jgi:hypothetical protein
MEDIIKLFTKENSHYDRILQFKIVSFFIVIITIFSKLFNSLETTTYIIILLVFGMYTSTVFLKTIDNDLNDVNKITFFKLESLQEKVYEFLLYKINQTSVNNTKLTPIKQQELFEKNKLDSLYIDAQMINFLYSIIKLFDYNKYEFYSLLKGTNNILKLHNEILVFYESNEGSVPENISEILENCIQLKVNCMNILQNFIYTVPKTHSFYNYIDGSVNTYEYLINKHIYDIHKYQKENINKGININTKFFHLDLPKGYDKFSNHSVIPSKNNDQLVDLYI